MSRGNLQFTIYNLQLDKEMKKTIFLFLFLIFGFTCNPVEAADFSSYYKTIYEFDANGNSFITQEISLVNESPGLFVSEYTLSLNGSSIDKIQAYDSFGPLNVTKTVKDDTTLVKLNFNEKVVGKNKILSFILKYQTKDLAQKKGNLWEISIPKLGKSDDISTYLVVLKVPLSFGKPSYINPKPDKEEKTADFYEISFNKEKLTSMGVLATFGKWQTFSFTLEYELKNEGLDTAVGEISLPPDTVFQDVYYDLLSPLPENVKMDKNGNWIASYLVPAKNKLAIKANGRVNVFASAKKDFPRQKENLDLFIKEDRFWEISNEKIKNIAKNLKTPREIYEFTIKTLSYDKSLINEKVVRKGAVLAIENPNRCLCSEFTDLFIALCRSLDIPARELEGFAYSDNPKIASLKDQDLLHSWPEYFDREKGDWVSVDPTFEKTSGLDYFNSFDMNHFVFVIHGDSSFVPYPAGSYKEDVFKKQVNVSFGEDFSIERQPDYSILRLSPQKLFSLKSSPVNIKIKNNSGYAQYKQSFFLDKPPYFPYEFYFEVLPPFSISEIKSTIKPKENFFDYSLVSLLSFNNQKIEFEQKVISLGLRAGVISGIFVSIMIIMILKSIKSKDKPLT